MGDQKTTKQRERKMIKKLSALILSVTCLTAGAYEKEFENGTKLTLGGDLTLRFTNFDRNVIWPDANTGEPGDDINYARLRSRVFAKFEFNDKLRLNARLVNRIQAFNENVGEPDNRDKGTWKAPDEVVFDDLNLEVDDLLGTGVDFTLGRQSLILGNGMVFLEGTPYDQGRSIYFDGIKAVTKGDQDTLTTFVFYNKFEDPISFISDEDLRLRRGDTLTAGAYWTHNFNKLVNTDLYAIFIDIQDDYPTEAERNHPADENANFMIYGARLFGDFNKNVGYSFEIAKEDGEVQSDSELTGMMADARLTLKADEGTKFSPQMLFQLTYMSGDDPNSDEYEGWHPAFAEYPIWREEIMAINNNGNWTNLIQPRMELKLQLTEKLSVTGAYTYMFAEEKNGTGNGDDIGQVISAFVDYKINDSCSFAFEAASFIPGDYYDDGCNSEWLRAQFTYNF